MNKNTERLLNEIIASPDAYDVIAENEDEFVSGSLHDRLNRYLFEKGLTVGKIAEATSHAAYVRKIFSGERNASRDILISIAFAMKLSLAEVQRLLRIAGNGRLDPRIRRDAAIIYGFAHDLDEASVNDILYEIGEETL